MKKILLIVILILVVVGIALTWFIISRQNQDEVLQSSSYVDMFGTDGIGENIVRDSFRENIRFDILEISEDGNEASVAKINVVMPDLAKTFREIHEKFNTHNMQSDELDAKMRTYMNNHSTTIQREFEVVKQNGEWIIVNNEEFNILMAEQLDALTLELLRTIEFTPIR